MFSDTAVIRAYLTTQTHLDQMPPSYAKLSFISMMMQLVTAESAWERVFTYAYGASFAPDTSKTVPFIDYPYSVDNGQLILHTAAWNRYERGFGDLANKVEQHKDNLRRLAAIGIDVGRKDEYAWIPRGCEYFSGLLNDAGVPHQLITHDAAHQDQLRSRIEGHMLPFFARVLR